MLGLQQRYACAVGQGKRGGDRLGNIYFFFIVNPTTSRPYPSHVRESRLVHAAATKIVPCCLVLLVVLACERLLVVVAFVVARGARMPIFDTKPARVARVPVCVLLCLV